MIRGVFRAAGPAAAAIFGAISFLGMDPGLRSTPAMADGGRGLSLVEAVRHRAGERRRAVHRPRGRAHRVGGHRARARRVRPPPVRRALRIAHRAAAIGDLVPRGRPHRGRHGRDRRPRRDRATYTISGGLVRQDRDDPFSTYYDGATTAAVRAEAAQPLWRGAFCGAPADRRRCAAPRRAPARAARARRAHGRRGGRSVLGSRARAGRAGRAPRRWRSPASRSRTRGGCGGWARARTSTSWRPRRASPGGSRSCSRPSRR